MVFLIVINLTYVVMQVNELFLEWCLGISSETNLTFSFLHGCINISRISRNIRKSRRKQNLIAPTLIQAPGFQQSLDPKTNKNNELCAICKNGEKRKSFGENDSMAKDNLILKSG